MHSNHNLISRRWGVTINVSANGKPRDLTGYRALCLDLQPSQFVCFVEIDRPKTNGIVNLTFFDDGKPSNTNDPENIQCEIGLQNNLGEIEKFATLNIEM
jgi:hypothetical protein